MTHQGRVFKLSARFQMIIGSSLNFKCIGNRKLCLLPALSNFDFKLTSDITIQPPFSGITFLTMVMSTCVFYVLIGENSTGEFMRKIYSTSGN